MQQMNKPYEGLFITIEGGDGCGKTTVCNHIAKELQKKGYHVLQTREPGGTQLSEKIREIVLSPSEKAPIGDKAELLLFLAARAQHFEEKIKPALLQGRVVICERFHDSSIAYQGCARHLGRQFVENMCVAICDHPNFTLLLDLDPEEGMSRLQTTRDRLEKEDLQFHREVRQGYLHLADEYPERIAIVDASLPVDQVANQALKLLEPHLMLRPTR